MAFQAVPNSVEVVITLNSNGRDVNNVLHFKQATEPDVAAVQTLVESIGDWVVDSYLPTCGNTTHYVQTTGRGLSHAVDVMGIHTSGAGTNGSLPASMTNNVTKAFTFQSGLTGRNSRGRMFHAGVSQDSLTGRNHVTQGFIDDFIDVLNLLQGIVQALDWAWVIVSRYTAGVKRTTGITYDVTAFAVSNDTTDSMRSRLPTS